MNYKVYIALDKSFYNTETAYIVRGDGKVASFIIEDDDNLYYIKYNIKCFDFCGGEVFLNAEDPFFLYEFDL